MIDFTRRFEDAWNRVPPHFRKKETVIAWLEARLEESQRNVAASPARLGDAALPPAAG